MPTIRSETRTISIAAPPEAVLDVVGDPRNLPRWAPAFAKAVRPAERDGQWLVAAGGDEFPIAVRASREHGTVDLLDPREPRRGAFTRVLPTVAGSSEFLFTLFFEDGTPDAAVDAQMQTVEEELATVRALSEAR